MHPARQRVCLGLSRLQALAVHSRRWRSSPPSSTEPIQRHEPCSKSTQDSGEKKSANSTALGYEDSYNSRPPPPRKIGAIHGGRCRYRSRAARLLPNASTMPGHRIKASSNSCADTLLIRHADSLLLPGQRAFDELVFFFPFAPFSRESPPLTNELATTGTGKGIDTCRTSAGTEQKCSGGEVCSVGISDCS